VAEINEPGGAAMPVVTKEQAHELLTNAVQDQFGVDELLEIYNEVFPDHPYTHEQAEADSGPLVKQLVARINSGLGIDEVMDLWRLIFTKHRNVWYDEEEERMHYKEESEVVPYE
jgi:hypothetical protein